MKRTSILFLGLVSVSALGQAVAQNVEIGASSTESADEAGPIWNPQLDEYMVETGDTLWTISERVVGDPFLWPKVWAFNPEITNPHWIYPGDMIRFYEIEFDFPSQTELIAAGQEIPAEDVQEIEGQDGDETAEAEPDIEVIETIGAAKLAASRLASQRYIGVLITEQELQETGTLTNARKDKILLDNGDRVFFTFEGTAPNPGDRYLTYRTLKSVRHPVTGASWGYLTQITGELTIERAQAEDGEGLAQARIDHVVAEVERGQFVTPMLQDPRVRIDNVPSTKNIDGYILAVREQVGTLVGLEEFVFIDKGKKDGLERGNRLNVLVRGDPVTGESDILEFTEIGQLQVIDAQSTASTCLVVNSRRELEPGYRVSTVVQ